MHCHENSTYARVAQRARCIMSSLAGILLEHYSCMDIGMLWSSLSRAVLQACIDVNALCVVRFRMGQPIRSPCTDYDIMRSNSGQHFQMPGSKSLPGTSQAWNSVLPIRNSMRVMRHQYTYAVVVALGQCTVGRICLLSDSSDRMLSDRAKCCV